MEEGGVDEPYTELIVEEDFVIGMVLLDSFELFVPL
jgi:hypothetical protein